MVYGRWCPKRVRGTGQAGQTSLAGWARQGRSRGSICVYRTTRVWGRRCSDTSAIIALRLAPIRPSRQHYAHLLVRVTPPPLTRRRPPYLLRLPTARAASGPTRALQWAACLGTRAARRRGASVTTWSPARVRAGGPRNARHFLPCPFLASAAASSRNVVPMHRHLHTSRRSSRLCAVRGRGSAEALRTLLPCATRQHAPHPTPCSAVPTMVMRRTWRSQLHKSSRPCSLPSQCAHPPLPVSWFTELTCSCPSAPVCPPSAR